MSAKVPSTTPISRSRPQTMPPTLLFLPYEIVKEQTAINRQNLSRLTKRFQGKNPEHQTRSLQPRSNSQPAIRTNIPAVSNSAAAGVSLYRSHLTQLSTPFRNLFLNFFQQGLPSRHGMPAPPGFTRRFTLTCATVTGKTGRSPVGSLP